MFKSLVKMVPGLVSLLWSGYAFSQNPKIDSLNVLLAGEANEYRKVTLLNQVSREFWLLGKYDTTLVIAGVAKNKAIALGYERGRAAAIVNEGNVSMSTGDYPGALALFEQALEIQKSIGDVRGAATSINNMGNVYLSQGILEDALMHYKAALKIRLSGHDQKGVSDCYNNIGIVQYHRGNLQVSLKAYMASLKIVKMLNDKNAIARSYNNIGSINLMLGDFEGARRSFTGAIKMQQELGDSIGLGRSYNNLANIDLGEGKYPEALQNFKTSLLIKERTHDYMTIASNYINIGNVHYVQIGLQTDSVKHRALMDTAHANYFKALEWAQAIGDRQSMAQTYNSIGTVYVSKSNPAEAIRYLNLGLAAALEVGSASDIKYSYLGLAAADSARGAWESAYMHKKMYYDFRDSLVNEENIRATLSTQLNYEHEEEQKKNQAIHDKKAGAFEEKIYWQNVMGWTSGVTFVFILFSTFLWFNRNRHRQQAEFQQQLARQQQEQASAIIETQEQERKRIAEDLHDSLGHLLSTVKMNLQTLPESQKHYYINSINLLNQASTEMHNISFNLMPQTLEDEGLIPALYELAEKTKKSSLYDIMLQVHDMDNFVFDKQMKYNIYRIVQEAVNNILKHAEAKEINIQLIKREDHLTIMIEDDGKGFDMAKVKMTGRGLRNITARSEWLHGSITIDSTPGRGTTIAIEIPIKKTQP
jgi:two-component system, NarL family, sensor kinase